MRRSINLLLIVVTSILLCLTTSCSSKEKLFLLNWGEYINMELVEEFEELYNCEVVISLADSNDLFYSKVKSGTTVYDIVIPSDYMVCKMYEKDLLQPIDYTKLGYATYEEYLNVFVPGVRGIIGEMEESTPNIKNYFVPYFWGTWGIMYDNTNQALVSAINSASNPWGLIFDDTYVPDGTKVGVYDTSRYVYAMSMLYLGKSPNEQSEEALNLVANVLNNRKFTSWSTDTLKKDIARGNLDIAFMWTGDFLDMYYQEIKSEPNKEVGFDILIPDNTVAFCDSMVITKNARNSDLAHKFIKFFLDGEVSYRNASIVGYCTPTLAAYDKITEYTLKLTETEFCDLLNKGQLTEVKVNKLVNGAYVIKGKYNTDTFILEVNDVAKFNLTVSEEVLDIDAAWLYSWSYAVSKYYPKYVDNAKGFKGQVLTNLSREYVDEINIVCNNARS